MIDRRASLSLSSLIPGAVEPARGPERVELALAKVRAEVDALHSVTVSRIMGGPAPPFNHRALGDFDLNNKTLITR